MSHNLIPKDIVIADSTVLINFIQSQQFMLLLRVFDGKLHVTDIVRIEIKSNSYVLTNALKNGKIVEHPTDLPTLAHIVKSFSSFDEGEASCLLLAEREGWRVATDDGAAKSYISTKLGPLYVVTTFDILLEAIQMGYIAKAEALAIVREMEVKANFQYSPESFQKFKRSLT